MIRWNKYLFLLLLMSAIATSHAQKFCRPILEQAVRSLQAGNFPEALKQLQATETCDFQNALLAERQTLQQEIFEAIQQQKEEAVTARKEAEALTVMARQQTELAEARRLASLAQQLAKERKFYEALQVAQAAYHRTVPPPAEVYEAFTGIFEEGGEEGVFVYRARLYGQHEEYPGIFSPDGQRFLTMDLEETMNLWDLRGNLISNFNELLIDPRCYRSGTFSADGQHLLTFKDSTAHLWDRNGRLIAAMQHPDQLESVGFAPGVKAVMTHTKSQPISRFWDLQGERLSPAPHIPPPTSVPIPARASRTMPRFYHCTMVADTVQLWLRGQKDELIANLPHPGVRKAVFSPDRQHILSSGYPLDKLWDLNGTLLAEFADVAASFLRYGQRLLVEDMDRHSASLWDFNGNKVAELEVSGAPEEVAYSPDRRFFSIITSEGKMYLWDIANGQLIVDLNRENHKFYLHKLGFSADGDALLVGGAFLYQRLRSPVVTQLNEAGEIHGIDFSPTAPYVLVSPRFGESELWDFQGRLVRKFEKGDYAYGIFSPDGQHILIPSGDTTKMWDLSGRLIAEFDLGGTGYIRSSSFSPDGQRILTHSDKIVKCWDLEGKLITEIHFTDNLSLADFSADGRFIRTKTLEQKGWTYWDFTGNAVPENERPPDLSLTRPAPNGLRLTSNSEGDYEGTVQLWDRAGHLLAELDRAAYPGFTPDGGWILTSVPKKFRYESAQLQLWPTPATFSAWIEQLALPPLPEALKKKYGIE